LILDDLEAHAEAHPDGRAALEVDAGGQTREMTWAQLLRASERTAAALMELGIAPGEPVAFQLPNRLEFLAIALGTLRIGAVCEPLMPIFREHELEFMLRASAARVLFVPDRFRGRAHAAMARDKKVRAGSPRFVVLKSIGSAVTQDGIAPDLVEACFREIGAR